MRWSRRATCWCRCSASFLRSRGSASCCRRSSGSALAFNPELSILGVALTMFDRRNNSQPGGRRRCPRLPRRGGVRDHGAAQRALVGSAEPRLAGVDLRPQMPRLRSLYAPRPRGDRAACRSWRWRHERRRPARASAWACPALLGEAARAPARAKRAEARGGVREIEVARIRPNPSQPRMQFDEEALDELAKSIAERGVLQPILLRARRRGLSDRRGRAALARGPTRAAARDSRRSSARSTNRRSPSWR